MSIFDEMRKITSGKIEKENENKKVALPGDTIEGIITAIPFNKKTKKPMGYFFIISDDLPFERIHAHWTALKQDTLRMPELRKRMRVEFELKYDEIKGFKAVKIKVIK